MSHPGSARPPCAGDCDGEGSVSVDELVRGVNIALGSVDVDQCGILDDDHDGHVGVNELVVAVNNALDGCPSFVGSFQAYAQLDGGQTATVAISVASDGHADATLTIIEVAATALHAGGIAASVSASGSVDLDTGTFSISGSFVSNGQTVPFSFSGSLPRPGKPGSITIQIGDKVYTGSYGAPATPTPTATPMVSGTLHHVTVGQPNLPFDPEYIEINPGDTVEWTWVGGPHSVRSTFPSMPGVPNCSADGRFDSLAKASGTFRFTFTAPGTYEYDCGVPGHCENFESGIIVVRGTPTPTRTATPTNTPTVAIPTVTPTPATIGGVSTAMLGVFSGTAQNQFGGSFPIRLQIAVDDGVVHVTELQTVVGNVLGGGTFTMTVGSPTHLSYQFGTPAQMVTLVVDLAASGHVTGTYTTGSVGMGTFTITFDVTREGGS
ncbi:MAG TPA: plastocyanin/azurin family copper-binding protein [Candidatus Binatia bacterium]|nr:plastocyanin/azurin family copper-binding protein [Candidatus Binatia bacterium]